MAIYDSAGAKSDTFVAIASSVALAIDIVT
jgi:hypothetical protein